MLLMLIYSVIEVWQNLYINYICKNMLIVVFGLLKNTLKKNVFIKIPISELTYKVGRNTLVFIWVPQHLDIKLENLVYLIKNWIYNVICESREYKCSKR